LSRTGKIPGTPFERQWHRPRIEMSPEDNRNPNPVLDRGKLRSAIEDAFTDLALYPHRSFHFISGAPLAERLRYTKRLLHGVPESALASFSGVGNPFLMEGAPRPGESVLDVGCGSGVDSVIAGRVVGPRGRVVGVDMTAAMVERAHQCVLDAAAANVRIDWGHAESLPLPDDSVDVVISNGVISLTPGKLDTFGEIARVLKPGGRLRIADVVVEAPLPPEAAETLHLWTECIAGATWMTDYPGILHAAGFVDAHIVETFDVFAGTRIEENSAPWGARGANVSARKPG
jgi:SAM-dependent methyltransferase